LTGTISISCHRMFFSMDDTFCMKDPFFFAIWRSAMVEDWGTADTIVVIEPLEAFVAVTIMVDGSKTRFCSSLTNEMMLWSSFWDSVIVNLSRFVVLFFLYLMGCLDLPKPPWDLFGSLKLRLFETGWDGLEGVKWVEVWEEYLSCSFWISLLCDFESRPCRTASAWDVTSAWRDARSLRILLISTRSQFSLLLSLLSFEISMIFTMPKIWSPNMFVLRDNEKHLPKILSQSIPKNLTLGSMSNPERIPRPKPNLDWFIASPSVSLSSFSHAS